MYQLTGYHQLLNEISSQLVNHGWGEMRFVVTSLKDNTVKVEVQSGKYHVFFIKKNLFNNERDNIL